VRERLAARQQQQREGKPEPAPHRMAQLTASPTKHIARNRMR